MLRKNVFAGVALGLSLTLGPVHSALAEYRPDAWVTMKTKLALLVSGDVDGDDISVDTVDGRVTLHGQVDSEQEKAAAEQRARDIEGVRDVQNLLQVVSEAEEERVEETDERISESIEELLDDDPRLEESEVEVESVNDGVVLLTGMMDSLSRHVYVVSRIRRVPGVRGVETQIEVPDELTEGELLRAEERVTVEADSDEAPSSEPDELGDGRNVFQDGWITTVVKTKLLANRDVPALDVNVDTRDGLVTLFGIVSSEEASEAAERTAVETEGVTGVRNELRVVPESQREVVEALDDDIEEQVEQTLENHQQLADADIDVEVEGGLVRLEGTVPSASRRMLALTIARSVAGVRAVTDELKVDREGGRDQ